MTRREWPTRCFALLLAGCVANNVAAAASPSHDGKNNPQNHRPMQRAGDHAAPRTRLLVLTDMSSIEAGVREPDDAQSMIRLMLYANEFDIEGLIASSSLAHDHVVRPWIIRQIVDAYGECQPNLIKHDSHYPTAAQLRRTIKSGQPNADNDMPVYRIIGDNKDTEASEWIIQKVDEADERPLWIVIWGGSADLAQALWKVRGTRSPEEAAAFVAKIRVAASVDQDSTGPWIKSRFPELFYATRSYGGRGMYRGGDADLVSSSWVQKNIKGHGALGAIYPDYRGGDIWWRELGEVRGIKGGDSATYMGLIPNGLNVRNHLNWSNWGGRIQQDPDNPQHYRDAVEPVADYKNDISPYLASVYQWRPDFQPAYAARFDWCVAPYSQANHAPHNEHGLGLIKRHVSSGDTVKLESGRWRDPDGNNLTFHWQTLRGEGSYPGKIKIEKQSAGSVRFTAPVVKSPQSIHVLLTVRDDGNPALSSYQRINFVVHP